MLYGGEILEDTYQIMQEIGKGGTGVIFLAWHLRLQKEVVVKKISGNFSGSLNVRAEADILKGLHHSSLPQVYDFLLIGQEIYTVMEYIRGCDLQQYLDRGCRFEERQLMVWLLQLCDVLAYLHTRVPQILHSDIKPANIMVTEEGGICLIDFGISIDGRSHTTLKGLSRYYAAPEQYEKAYRKQVGMDSSDIVLDERMDIYSLGATFYHLMTGVLPEPVPQQPYSITQQEVLYSDGLKFVIMRAMAYEREARFSSARAMQRAVEKIYKCDRSYRRLTVFQVLSGVACGLLLVLGIWGTAYGYKKMHFEAFTQEYTACLKQCEENGDISDAQYAQEVLSKDVYQGYFENDPESAAALACAAGDIYFWQEQFGKAAQCYETACSVKAEENSYCALAAALARDGQTEQAETVISEAERKGNSGSRLQLARQELAYATEAYDDVISIGGQLSEDKDPELAARSCIMTARAYQQTGDGKKCLAYLELAQKKDGSIRTLRELGKCCLELAKEETVYFDRLLARSEECYDRLWTSVYATENDGMNLAITLEMEGRLSESMDILRRLEKQGSELYQVYMHIAYILLQQANRDTQLTQAKYYYTQAKQLFEKAHVQDESMELLKELLESRE